jgi:phosphate transport system permease protein
VGAPSATKQAGGSGLDRGGWATTGSGERLGDRAFRTGTLILALSLPVLVALLLGSMLLEAALALGRFGLPFLWTSSWNPVTGEFGVLPAIYGTLVSSALALLIAVPVGLGAAIFLVEFSPPWLARGLSVLIELLAAIPSVVIGLWGILVMVPLLEPIQAAVGSQLGFIPLFSGPPLGIGMLAAGLVLSVMVLPILTAIIRDILQAVPRTQHEGLLALGATHWETVVKVVLPYGRSGIVGAIILALGRALGETLAVTMVIGNTYQVSPSLFSTATTLASLVASQFREADSPIYLSALISAGVILFAIALIVNIAARLLVWRVNSRGLSPAAFGAG